MDNPHLRELSSAAKLTRIVLENCGPLSPSEIADEAYLTTADVHASLDELEDCGIAKPVCGVRKNREEVYALIDTDEPVEPSP